MFIRFDLLLFEREFFCTVNYHDLHLMLEGIMRSQRQHQKAIYICRAFSPCKSGSGFWYQMFSQLAEKNPN